MKEVWIPGLNWHRFWRFYFSVYFLVLLRLRRYITHSRQCFIGHLNTSNFVKNTSLRVVLSAVFSVIGYPNETLSRVWHITSKVIHFFFVPCMYLYHWCFLVVVENIGVFVVGRPRGRRIVSIECFWQGLDPGYKKEQVKKNKYECFHDKLTPKVILFSRARFPKRFRIQLSTLRWDVLYVWIPRALIFVCNKAVNKCQNSIMTEYQFVSLCRHRSWRRLNA